jgi:hypothetical protein
LIEAFELLDMTEQELYGRLDVQAAAAEQYVLLHVPAPVWYVLLDRLVHEELAMHDTFVAEAAMRDEQAQE